MYLKIKRMDFRRAFEVIDLFNPEGFSLLKSNEAGLVLKTIFEDGYLDLFCPGEVLEPGSVLIKNNKVTDGAKSLKGRNILLSGNEETAFLKTEDQQFGVELELFEGVFNERSFQSKNFFQGPASQLAEYFNLLSLVSEKRPIREELSVSSVSLMSGEFVLESISSKRMCHLRREALSEKEDFSLAIGNQATTMVYRTLRNKKGTASLSLSLIDDPYSRVDFLDQLLENKGDILDSPDPLENYLGINYSEGSIYLKMKKNTLPGLEGIDKAFKKDFSLKFTASAIKGINKNMAKIGNLSSLVILEDYKNGKVNIKVENKDINSQANVTCDLEGDFSSVVFLGKDFNELSLSFLNLKEDRDITFSFDRKNKLIRIDDLKSRIFFVEYEE